MSPFSPGLTLHDRFTLRERIGLGGMSEVWRADDRVLGRAVAVKALASPVAADPLLQAATWREARAAARLTHPHVTQVYDYGEAALPGGRVPYLVMELVDGQNLADRLGSGPLPWGEAVRIGAQVAAALAAAHRLGIVHRDVKPGNVMLTASGAKVLDFGITALAGGRPDSDGGRLIGTPAYAAPERLRNGPAEPASDVYALGVLLYEALTGRLPVAAATWRDAEAAHRSGASIPPPDAPGLPRGVARLCLACLAPNPADRPTADELAGDLSAADLPSAGPGGQRPAGAAGNAVPSATATLPTTAAPQGAGYIVGSARLPHPATMIEPALAMDDSPVGAPPRRSTRPLMYVLIGAVVVLAIALAGVTGALLSGGRHTAAPASTFSPGATAPASSPASSSAAPPTSPAAVLDQMDQIITNALAAGTIDGDAADELRGKLNDLRDHLDGDHVQRQVQDLEDSISNMVDDGNIDDATANQLTSLLGTLGGVGGNGGKHGHGGGNSDGNG